MLTAAARLRLQRVLAGRFRRIPATQSAPRPIISFTFDDFPRSALDIAGTMLSDRGVRGTYYAALGLMGKTTIVGDMFGRRDLESLLAAGHELACHTFEHARCCDVTRRQLMISCENNRCGMAEILDGYIPQNFSFPEGVVTVSAKVLLSSVYDTCRTIESGINRDPVDLGFLRANRLYSHLEKSKVNEMFLENRRQNGWSILYTHDVSATPSPYGCTPQYFREVLGYAIDSGADILPIAEALKRFTLEPKAA